LTLGVQVGGDTFSEIIIFQNKQALERFKQGKTAFAVSASAVLVKAGAAGAADFPQGVKVLAYSRGGMLLEAAIGAQKFKFKPAGAKDQQDRGSGGKSRASGGAKQGKGRASTGGEGGDDQGEEEGEGDESSGLLGRAAGGLRNVASSAGGIVRDHPIKATFAGLAVVGAVFLAIRKLRSAAAQDQEDDGDQQESQEDDDQAQGNPESEDEGREDQDDEGDEGGENERGDMLGFLRRRRSRA
jgi:hypothetical protein